MNCNCCFEDWICKCVSDYIVINTRLTPAQVYYWRLVDKFNNVYSEAVTAEDDGTLQIPVASLPAGILNQFTGSLRITIHEDLSCGVLAIPLTKKYECIEIEIRGGTEEKNSIGCDVPCAAGSGQTVMIDFTEETEITIDWSLYIEEFGNNPIVQVYHEISENVFQLANVSIQQVRVNDVLTQIIVNNAGPQTGYILITA